MRHTIIYVMTILFLCISIEARADNIVTIGSAQGAPGDEVTLSIGLQNTSQVTALQLSIPMDDLLSYVEGSAELSARCTDHSVTAGIKDGVLNVMVYSMDMTAITGTEGEVVSLRLKLGNQPGDIALSTSKLLLTDPDGNAVAGSVQQGTVSIRCAKAQYGSMTVDFGRVPIRNTYQKTLTVRNIGNEPLVITGLEFSNYVTRFSSTTTFPLTIAAGGSTSINITYAPEERGTISETVKVLCNSISKLNTITLTAQPFAVNELHVLPAEGTADETITVSLTMNNMDDISGFQFEFTLPSQLEFVPNSFVLSDRKANHTVVQTLTNGVLRIIGYSSNDTPFADNDGVLATMQFKLVGRNSTTLVPTKCLLTATIDNQVVNVCSAFYGATITIRSPRLNAGSTLNMGRTPITQDAESEYNVRNNGNAPLIISRVQFKKADFYIREELPLTIAAGSSTTLHVVNPSIEEGDFNTLMQIYSNDPEQRLWNVTVTGNRFAPNYFEISTENEQSTYDNLCVDVSVNTYDPIVGLQFDLTYPGNCYEPYSDGYTLEERAQGMTVTWRQIDANTLRYFCYFLSGDGIAAGEGKVMSLLFAPIGGEVPGGYYTVRVKNIKLGTSDMADKYAGQDSEVSFLVYVPVLSISISDSSLSLEVGKTTTLSASVNDNATNQGVVWSSADESIATVSNDGVVTGKHVGTTTITVVSEENPDIKATCEVTVLIFPVESISISETLLTLEGGESAQLSASVNENATNKNVVWSSADRNIASVSETGKVVGRRAGTTTITVASEENPDIIATCEVTVTSDVTGILLPDAPFEFFYNAAEYDEGSHSIPNHPLANLSEYSLQLAENIPEKREDCMLHIDQRCRGYINRWADESTESGSYFYRTGNNCMTIVCKVSPSYGSGNNASDFISNRGSGYNYMLRIGDHGRMFLHTSTAYNASRSMAIEANEPQTLAVRVDGNNNYILLENLTTGESLRVNGVNWGGSNNIFKFFYNDSNEYFKGDFYWVYYSFELLTDEQIKYFADYLPGDVNRDKQISIADVTALVNIILGKDNTQPYQYDHDAADVNRDGTISIADVTSLVNIILGKE